MKRAAVVEFNPLEFCKPLEIFLNTLDQHLPQLVKPIVKSVWEEPTRLSGLPVVLLHGNAPLILHAFFRHVYDILSVPRETLVNVDGEDIAYKYSDRHLECVLTDRHISHLKSIVKNKSIRSDRAFIFYIHGLHRSNHHLQNQLKYVIEANPRAVFVLAARFVKDISPAIASMATPLYLGFPLVNMQRALPCGRQITKDLYADAQGDVISIFMRLSYNCHQTKMDKAIETFAESMAGGLSKHPPLAVILQCRELAYKLYHLNYPFQRIYRVLLPYATQPALFIAAMAQADHMSANCRKDVLMIERALLDTVPLLGPKQAREPEPDTEMEDIIVEVPSPVIVKKKIIFKKKPTA